MNKKICFLLCSFFFCFLFLAPSSIAKAEDYTIESFDVDIKVSAQNTYRITETITADFTQAKHGIYRDIPLINDVQRTDGSTDRIAVKVSNISCGDDPYEVSREGDYCSIQIGDEDETIIGEKVYTISYDYCMGNDVLSDADEFYFNVIGTEWKTSIKNVTFRIELPKDFDDISIGMSYGEEGSTDTEGLYYYREDNAICGELDTDIILEPYEGVNVRLVLEDGYFDTVETTPIMAYVAIVLAILATILAFVLWWVFGRDDPVVETVEFYPPDGLNSLELAFAYRGKAVNNDVVSLIVYLAQKGYIEIKEGTGKNSFTLIKKKDYEGVNINEQIFMAGLFEKKDVVNKKDLKNSFYKTVDKIVKNMNSKQNKEKIFHANSLNKSWIIYLLSVVCFVLAGFIPVRDYEFSSLTALIIPSAVGIVFMIVIRISCTGEKLISRISGLVLGLIVGAIMYLVLLADAFSYGDRIYQIAYMIVMVASMIAMVFCTYMSKRTPYGTQILGKIRGFKTFLATAEKERLETLVNDDPQYFYEILPYTYVLGVSDKWMKKFESITVEPPNWYTGNSISAFDVVVFNHFMSSAMSDATSSMTSKPSSSSGGGFSGGGSGGGGGGSW